MHTRTARSRAFRAALSGAGALVILAGVALPLGFSPIGMEPSQKTAHAKGGGSGAGGPPDHSSAGGQGGGHGNGHGGGLFSASDGYQGAKNKLGKLNAANAAAPALLNANPDSTVGQIAAYKQMVEIGNIKNFDGAKFFLVTFANKDVTMDVVEALNDLLGVVFLP